jgi:hypothetical protein
VTSSQIVAAALDYQRRGWWVTPVAGKAPILEDWPNTHLDEDAIRQSFGSRHNVGVVLGPSGLADLDFDDEVAIRAAKALRPQELEGAAMFKHGDRPHLIVKATGVETRRFKRADGSVLLEVRGGGAQTVFPPSIHPDGEPYVWVRDCDPSEMECGRLQQIAAMIATVAHAAEFWNEGSRHDLALALGGFLARRLHEDDVLSTIRAVATVAADAEFRDREGTVSATVRRLKAAETVTGLPTIDTLAPDLVRALASWWGPAAQGEEQAEEKKHKPSQADSLVEIGRAAQLFHDTSGAAFAKLSFDDHCEIWALTSKRFKSWLRREHFLHHGKAPNSDAVNSAGGVLEGIACFDGAEHELHNRLAWHDGAIWYDLTDSRWRAVRVDATGWRVVDRPPTLFRRYAHQRAQVEPAPAGDARGILRFLNVRHDDELLLLAWLVAAFVPEIPHPIPDFHGEKGSGKTAGQRALRRLIDPSTVESLAFPTDVRELVQQLSHHYAPLYDNIDGLPGWISDMLCRAITGDGFSKRELYSDDEDVIYAYRRVVMLNGINVVPQRADLLDRSILIALDRIPRRQRREEREFWRDFELARPGILGGIFDTLSKAITIYPNLQLPALERMADFTRWGAAVSEALGFGGEAFLDAYSSNLGVQTREAVQGHIVGAAVLALMENREEWAGSPTDLLAALEEAGEDAKLFRRTSSGKVDAKRWPGAPHILTRRLNEVRSNLSDLAVDIMVGRADDRTITIRRTAPEGAENSVGSVGSDAQIRLWPISPDATADATGTASLSSDGKNRPSQIRPDAADATVATLPLLEEDSRPQVSSLADDAVFPIPEYKRWEVGEPCYACRRTAWRQRPDGGWVCGVCHPDPLEPGGVRVLLSGDGRRPT